MSETRQDIAKTISQIAKNQVDIQRLTIPKLDSVAAEIFAQNMRVTEVQRGFARQADMLVSVRSRVESLSTYAIQVKKLRDQLDTSAIKDFAKALDDLRVTKGILISTSRLSEATKALAEQHEWRMEIIDASGLRDLAREYVKTQEALAASLAFRIRGLKTRDFAHLRDQTPESVDAIDTRELHLPTDYAQLIVRTDRMPLQILRDVLRDPRHMHELTPRQFEEFIANVVDRLGFRNVILTPPSGDGGRDVIASKEMAGIPITFYFECKKYASGNKVQLDTLRALLGTVAHHATEANVGVLVTTSHFTQGCKDLVASECRLDGKDYEGLLGWVGQLNVEL